LQAFATGDQQARWGDGSGSAPPQSAREAAMMRSIRPIGSPTANTAPLGCDRIIEAADWFADSEQGSREPVIRSPIEARLPGTRR